MFSKFSSKSDNELVFEYKKTHQDDLEYEIISRYQKHSKLLAGLLFTKFKFLYQVEYDDIYCILLASLFTAIKGFSDNKIVFYQYWKTIAINDVHLYVSQFSQNANDFIKCSPIYNEEPVLAGYLRDKSALLNDDYLSSFDLDDILDNPKNKLKKKDVDVFRLYLAGYSLHEIADMTDITYSKVRYCVNRVRKKLANILFNQ